MSSEKRSANRKSGERTLYLTRLALMTAVMIIMAFTPLGYFHTPLLSVTLMSVPVAIGGILFGPLAGAYGGLVFGITSVVNAVATGGLTGMLLLINPPGALFTMIVPRMADGCISALIFRFFKRHRAKRAGVFVSSLCCPVLNTVLFMASLILIFFDSDYIQGLASSLGTTDPLLFLAAFVGVQGIIEAAACFVLSGLISTALLHVVRSE